MRKKLFLVSSSRSQGGGYFEHCATALQAFLGPLKNDEVVAFIPYALKDHDTYANTVGKAFATMGYNLVSVHTPGRTPMGWLNDPKVKAVFVGGGNTFRLRAELEEKNIFLAVKELVENLGIKYIGSSAGSNMACPTIMTTNDMPIVYPNSFEAFNFVNFQINPHFIPGNLIPGHMGETRETRLKEYHEENTLPVVGLTETNWIILDDNEITLHGEKPSFIFEKNMEPRMWQPGSNLIL